MVAFEHHLGSYTFISTVFYVYRQLIQVLPELAGCFFDQDHLRQTEIIKSKRKPMVKILILPLRHLVFED